MPLCTRHFEVLGVQRKTIKQHHKALRLYNLKYVSNAIWKPKLYCILKILLLKNNNVQLVNRLNKLAVKCPENYLGRVYHKQFRFYFGLILF